jgi:hypothetical protein
MRVTFDTNTLDKACRPERFAKDDNRPLFQKVHDALKDGTIQGFYSVTILTLEGIMKADRPAVMGGTKLEHQPMRPTVVNNADLTDDMQRLAGEGNATVVVPLKLKVVQPARQPLHPELIGVSSQPEISV